MSIPTAMCIECSHGDDVWEFPSMRDLIAHKASGHTMLPPKRVLPPSLPKGPSATELKEMKAGGPPPDVASKVVVAEKIPPLELVYKWQGRHDVCHTEVKTISVDLGKSHAIIAYCLACDKNIQQKMVIPISKQTKQQLDSFPETSALSVSKK